MIVVAILSIPFIFYFVKSDLGQIHSDSFARIYDRNISIVEARKYARLLDLARALGMSDLPQDLTVGAKEENEAYPEFVLNLMILRHEADRLGIQPTQAQVVETVHDLPAFRSASGFDLKKYDEFIQNALSPRGMGEADLEELVRDELSLKQIKQLLDTGVTLSESLSKTNFDEAYGTLHVSVIRFQGADAAKEIKISDEDVQKYFDEHKGEFKTEEKRKVDYVELALTGDQKKLTGKPRIDALQKLADRANDFSQGLLEKGADFKQVAVKFQLPMQTTGEFTMAAPDPKLKAASPELSDAAFKLTRAAPNGDPVQVVDGFYILHLDDVVASRPLTLEEAKPKVVEALKRARGQEIVKKKGLDVVNELQDALKSGQSFEAAAQKAGVKVEKIPPFAPIDEANTSAADQAKQAPDLFMIKNIASSLQPGSVSNYTPWEDGGFIVYLEKREPPDAAKYAAKKAEFDQRYLNSKQQIVFYEWLHDRQQDAGLVTAAAPTGKS